LSTANREEGLALGHKQKLAEYSGATASDFHRLPHFATTTAE
jgi:hypothetical protein